MSVYRRNQTAYVIVYDFISHADTANSIKVDIDIQWSNVQYDRSSAKRMMILYMQM